MLKGEAFLVLLFIGVAALGVFSRVRAYGAVILPAWVALMSAIVGFCVANRRVRGFPLLALGAAMNLLVIVANGAMPVLPSALAAAGASPFSPDALHLLGTTSTRAIVLADVLPMAGPAPLHGIFSAGDVVMGVGLAVVCGSIGQGRRVER
jgi:hypothetical protein